MGTDFRRKSSRERSKAHWSYSGFNSFRRKLAQEIGMNLDDMDGFTANGNSWEGWDDSIIPLLDHSDCEGELSPEDCGRVAFRLRELVQNWAGDPSDLYDKEHALHLAETMEQCAARGEYLEFC